MQWSKQRQMFRALICQELRDVIDIHVTGYHEAHDQVGEAWITVDGEKIFDAGHYKYWGQWHRKFKKQCGEWNDRYDNAREILKADGIHDEFEIKRAVASYLQADPHEALEGADALLQAFAIVDRRIGKRSLNAMIPIEHPLVFAFLTLRALVS